MRHQADLKCVAFLAYRPHTTTVADPVSSPPSDLWPARDIQVPFGIQSQALEVIQGHEMISVQPRIRHSHLTQWRHISLRAGSIDRYRVPGGHVERTPRI